LRVGEVKRELEMKNRNLKYAVVLGVLAATSVLAGAPAADPVAANARLIAAVRQGDLANMRAALDNGASPNAKDAEATPAVMLATLYASAPAVELLLDKDADPNATNPAQATALIWAAGDGAKVRALLAKGANPNARSLPGRTPLLAAAARDGSYEVVKMLVEKGADIHAKDGLEGFLWMGGGGGTPLIEAAKTRDIRTVRYLLDKGAAVNARDHVGANALLQAAARGSVDIARLLMERGADVNVKASAWEMTPLITAVQRESAEMVELMLSHGADVNGKDATGSTPLMWAAYSDRGVPKIVARLLAAGADPNVKNKMGETALTWAARHGHSAISVMLGGGPEQARRADAVMPVMVAGEGMPGADAMKSAVRKSLAVLEKGGPQFFKVSGCISCHNQTLPLAAGILARKHGIEPDTTVEKQQFKALVAFMKPTAEITAENTDILPDLPISGGYIAEALAAAQYAPDAVTAGLVHTVAAKQMTDGSWLGVPPRQPIESGDIQATAYSIRSLRLYAMPGRKEEFDARVAAARNWLSHTVPVTTEDKVMKLFGLSWANASRDEISAAADDLLASQRSDGGWAQLGTLASDAYATGKVMVALHDAAGMDAAHSAYQRGVLYLMRTQNEDGSWQVKTRAFPFQPLKDSGFPHGRDQWISAAGTSWASMAISHALDATHLARR
jgi:ankyrin repeat protein